MTPPTGDPAVPAGIVLVGGASRRMGRDKATLPVPGSSLTLVEHLVGLLGRRCRPVFVVAAPGQHLPALPAQLLYDEVGGLGPLPATGLGLRTAAAAGAQRAFVAAVDLPLLGTDLIDTLTRVAAGIDAGVVLPWDGRDHYLAAVYRCAVASRIDALVAAGERRMRALVAGLDAQRVVVGPDAGLTNLNSPADLAALPVAGPAADGGAAAARRRHG